MTFYVGVFCVECKYNLVARLETETEVFANSFNKLYLSPSDGTSEKVFFFRKEVDNDDEIEFRSIAHRGGKGNFEFKMLVAKGKQILYIIILLKR